MSLDEYRESAVQDTHRHLRAAQRLTGLALWDWDVRTGRLSWSPEMFALVGREPDSVEPDLELWTAHIVPEDRASCSLNRHTAMATGVGYEHTFRVRRTDGEVRWLESSSSVETDSDGVPRRIFGVSLDVTDRMLVARSLAESEEHFRVAFEQAPTAMAMVSLDPARLGQLLRANGAFADLLGYPRGELVGRDPLAWTAPPDLAATWSRLHALAAGRATTNEYEKRYLRRDGTVLHAWVTTSVAFGPDGEPRYAIAHLVDETERRRHQHELERLALTDHLTGLANRSVVDGHLADALARLRRDGRGVVGVLMLDLDGFKLVNESRGHPVGDSLLVEIAHRLDEVTRGDTTVARLGGDEFLLIERARGVADVEALAERVLDAVRTPFALPSGQTIVPTASLGITTAADPGAEPAHLLSEADLALYHAKDSGRDRFALFDDGLRAHILDRVETETRLRAALLDGTLRLELQPVVDLLDGRTVAAEALLRLDDPELGELSPTDVIGVAEASGLIVEVDSWVVEEVVRLLGADARAVAQGHSPALPPQVAVNVSGRTVEHPSFVPVVRAALDAHGVSGHRLLVELTESTLLADRAPVRDTLAALADLGVEVGIDDFGTGYSALAYLERFSLGFLKIDISFTRQLGTNLRANAVVAAIIALAHAHGLVVTAEGVESEGQAAALRAMSCDRGQGWLLGRPAPPAVSASDDQ